MLSPESEDTLECGIEIGILCHADFNRISFNYLKNQLHIEGNIRNDFN